MDQLILEDAVEWKWIWKESQGTIMVDQTQRDNVEYFSCLSNMVTIDASCTREIKSRIAMANAAF